ncbi:MAG: phospho-sugar mutase [Clostridia bacterium]|nr:phospho-sugar mutase [Clostridia bacterium]
MKKEIKELYDLWCEKTKGDEALQSELLSVKDSEEEISDRFYRSLEFGTGGLRGVLGAGTNRMNIYTVNQATQGLADFLNSKYENPSVALAYDSRRNSDVFAKEAAGVLAANGIKVYIYPELVPTPMLSFAIRKLSCSSGIIITASHNPAKYNGYKCYAPEGYQMTDDDAAKTYEFISRVDIFEDVRRIDFDKGIKDGIIEYIDPSVNEEFYECVLSRRVNPQAAQKAGLKLIYTPLNGTGNKPVREVLKRAGFSDVTVVPSQENPDGNFPTCPYPNPEIRQAFEEALKLAADKGADLLLATDPDCDRVGIAVNDGGEYKLMSGNEVGVLLTEYVLSSMKEAGTLPKNPAIAKSFVTTPLVTRVAESYGCEVADFLTGFKYIGEFVTNLEKVGEENRFILGMEESYGYLSGTHARDKDAVVATLLVCEMAAYYKEQGKTLIDVMNSLYEKYGFYNNSLLNFAFEGESGMTKMASIMTALRDNAPKAIADLDVLTVSDYQASQTTDTKTGDIKEITLPKSNVLAYALADSNSVIIRPSGTEPKLKIYVTACAATADDADKLAQKIGDDMKKILGI